MNNKALPEIVARALKQTVTDIGQLTKKEIQDLEKYVRKGILEKGKGGPYPKLKNVYALKGFNFESHREESLIRMKAQI